MLVDVMYQENPIATMIAQISGNSVRVDSKDTGIYEIGHFSFDTMIKPYYEIDQYPDLKNIGSYGVCDNYLQVLEQEPDLIKSDNKYVITVTPINKDNQPEEGGWRWHKWGSYIGTQKPTTEYLYDEPEIEEVYVYHVYQILKEYGF